MIVVSIDIVSLRMSLLKALSEVTGAKGLDLGDRRKDMLGVF